MPESKSLEDALDFTSIEARYLIVDALGAYFHNEGQSLAGNTEQSDVRWFAVTLYELHRDSRAAWETLSDSEQAKWLEISQHTIRILPFLVNRIASRYHTISAALKTLEEVERARRHLEREKRILGK